MFTALVLVCANGIISEESCYFMASPILYESYQSCMISSYQMTTNNKELLETFDEKKNSQMKISKVRCVNWKDSDV